MRRLFLVLLVAVSLTGVGPRIGAGQISEAPAVPRRVTLTLEDSLRLALGRSPEIRQVEADVEGLLGKQLQARGLGYPQTSVTTVLGPSPRARGDQVSSPDEQFRLSSPDFSLIDGVFLGANVAIIQPIFTWGLIKNARLAAEHGLQATRAGVVVKSTEVALRVKQAYWGLVVAKTLRSFLLELLEQLEGAVDRTERLIEGGFTTQVDLFRLKTGKGELEKNLSLVEKNLDIARAALAAWTGQPAGVVVEPAAETLPAELPDIRALELFVADARTKRPEFVQLREGIKAHRNLVEVERKKRYPLFFFGVVGSATYATNRDRLDNPFVFDPLNSFEIGPVIGAQYSLDFGIAAGRVKEAEAELHKLEALQGFAEEGIPLQIQQAYGSVVEAKRNVEAFDQAHQNAKRWLVVASSNFDLGIGETRDLADAFIAFAKTRGEYLQALFAHVFGLAELAHAAGLDVEEVRRLTPHQSPGDSGTAANRQE